MKYLVKYLEVDGCKEIEIEADYMNQAGNLAIEFRKYESDGGSLLIAAFSKEKFVSAISKE